MVILSLNKDDDSTTLDFYNCVYSNENFVPPDRPQHQKAHQDKSSPAHINQR